MKRSDAMNMKTKTNESKQNTKDLRKEEPRAPEEKLGGFESAARVLDKCRATLAGQAGEYEFGCSFDQSFARKVGIDLNEFKKLVATGATDDEVADWLRVQAHANSETK